MNFHVTFNERDLLGLSYAGYTSPLIGRLYVTQKDKRIEEKEPSFYVKPGGLRAIADHFNQLAQEAGE